MANANFLGLDAWLYAFVASPRPLVLASGSAAGPLLDEVLCGLKERGCDVQLIFKAPGEPSTEEVDTTLAKLSKRPTEVIAIGGGSTIDLAKAVSLSIGSGVSAHDFEFSFKDESTLLPISAIPTTPGSGSEFTHYSVLNSHRTNRKFTLADERLRPKSVVIEPRFVSSLPRMVILDSSFDAFSHCLESALKPRRTSASIRLSLAGIRIALAEFPKLGRSGIDSDSALRLAWLGALGGLCISRERTGLIHTLSVSYAPHLDFSHGRLNRLLMPHVLDFNVDHYGGDLAKLIGSGAEITFENDPMARDYLVSFFDANFDISAHTGCFASVFPDKVVTRILEDTGLPQQNHRPISTENLENLVASIGCF